MLKREEAQKQLARLRVKGWQKARLAAVAALPAKLAAVGHALVGRDAAGKSFRDWEKARARKKAAGEELAALSARDRKRLFAVFFPQLAETMEKAYGLAATQPVAEDDFLEKPFRAPRRPELAARQGFSLVENLVSTLDGFDPDIAWVTAWAPYVSSHDNALGVLLAAALDAGNEEVFDILKASATNEHEIGSMGRHVVDALLIASRPDGWEFIEKLLLAAQRQEGLRQAILESVQSAQPAAFRRMLGVILNQNLLRFSSVVQAVDGWFGLNWSALSPAVLKKTVEEARSFLDDAAARDRALAKGKPDAAYLALWALAFDDAEKALEPARKLLRDKSPERRYVAVWLLGELPLPEAKEALEPMLDDEDLNVALTALEKLPEGVDRWDALLRLRERMPAKAKGLEPLVWPWQTVVADRREIVGKLAENRGKRPVTALLPFLGEMESWDRYHLVEKLAKLKTWDAATRDALFGLVADRDSLVRGAALKALKKCAVTESDAERVEGFLARKGSEMRQGALALLVRQKAPAALASADRLLGAKKEPLRRSGLELLRLMVEKKKAAEECRERARAYEASHEPDDEERLHLDAIFDVKREKPTLKDGLGLLDAAGLSPAVEPRDTGAALMSPAALACLLSLDELIHSHRKTPIKLEHDDEGALLGNVEGWRFPDPEADKPRGEDVARLPLADVWMSWSAARPASLRDADGLELVRALNWSRHDPRGWAAMTKKHKGWGDLLARMSGGQEPAKLRKPQMVSVLLEWLIRLAPPAGGGDFALDVLETCYSLVPAAERSRVVALEKGWQHQLKDWRFNWPGQAWERWLEYGHELTGAAWSRPQQARLWALMHWRDRPAPGVGRVRPDPVHLAAGVRAGLATADDIVDALVGPGTDAFDGLATFTAPRNKDARELPLLRDAVQRVVARIVEIESARAEPPTAATEAARSIERLEGQATLFRLLAALGKEKLSRDAYGDGKADTLTHLVKATHPAEGDTPESFAAASQGMGEARLLELAFAAPQWLGHVEQALGWPGLQEGAWWFMAHMPGASGIGDVELDDEDEARPQSPWERLISERTPLTAEDRQRGAVDGEWFHRVHEALGAERWATLAAAAKHGGRGNDHKKAARLADVLLGKADRAALVAEVQDKKLKESVRLLGLLPLPGGSKREAELGARYKVLAEYRRYARALSPMSREQAVDTAQVGLENLARTAGYPDPIRMEWAMEARDYADLARGPVSASHGGVTVTLSIDESARPEVTVRRGEKPLKNIPSETRKGEAVAALLERRNELKRSASRVKGTMEGMMVRGDGFSAGELRQLFGHPLLRPVLERLVVLGEGVAGYPDDGGKTLRSHTGKKEPVKADERLRVAHPHDLYATGDWDRWQAECFASERVQPLKQVFRELYVLTAQEKEDGKASSRYAGQQVNPSQGMALFGSRGWTADDGIQKTFHEAGLVAEVEFQHHGWTGAQVEGATVEKVRFRKKGGWETVALAEVPPRLFSEVMRDCDLVVSVAHVGGVDPEASASTTEMRASLVRETCGLLGLANVTLKERHAFVKGVLGSYTVHLGSGVIHRQPGGSLCVVPVHSQHRGRLFLPFADDDPRTAEVVSKVLLLAKDGEIQDPSILEQLR